MQPSKRKHFYSALLIGLMSLFCAFGYQRYYLATHPPLPQPVARQSLPPSQQDTAANSELARLEEAVIKAPHDISKRWALADAYQKTGQLPLAARQLQQITVIDSKNAEARLALGDVSFATRDFGTAAKSYQEHLRLAPKSIRAWQGLTASFYHQKRYFEALEAAQKARSLAPGDVNNDVMLGACALEFATQYLNPRKTHSEELELAKRHFEKAIKRLPKNGELYLKLGTACTILQDSACAVNNLRRAHQLLPGQPKPAVMLGRALMLTGNRQAAQEHLTSALQHHHENAELHFLLASLYRMSKAPDAAQLSYESSRKAAELSPDKSAYQEAFGMAALRAGKLEEARAAFEHAIQRNPDSRLSYLQLSAIYNKLGQTRTATEYAKKASLATVSQSPLSRLETLYARRPKDVDVYLMLADQYAAEGALRAARDIYLQALRLQPTNQPAKAKLAALETQLSKE